VRTVRRLWSILGALRDPKRLRQGVRRRWRGLRTSFSRPAKVCIEQIEVSPEQGPVEAARAIKFAACGLIRRAIPEPERLYRFAYDRLVVPKDDGNNMLWYISHPAGAMYETDLWLVRHALAPRVIAIACAYFQLVAGTTAFYLPYNTLLIRRFDSGRTRADLFVPYHQDGGSFPSGAHILNCWTLLYPDECGTTSPGLDLAPAAPRHLVAIEPNSTSAYYRALEARHDYVERFGGDPITPSVRLGDVMMFNGFCLHRTSTRPIPGGPRVSAEIRLVAANRAGRAAVHDQAHASVANGRITWASRWCVARDSLQPVAWRSAAL
jgi:hypothetical protein